MGVIITWFITPLAIQWSGDGMGYLFGTAAIRCGLLPFEYGQAAGKWVRDTLLG